ncbi:redoxin domain-containing protein [Opitutus terrae]|uniref:Redoxin domain protein n=1 Tax=Opitutus terrae (strain DSM 11246 / JCM 15787 / PB90-1) TaxID=452637 RepID=B1ZN59_OPITP|nr:redoxin domain-containing protein [Opitutus terrae]ACB73428.1 Redoxin domain protein [Opitutus terrae PB90-1]
MRHFCSLLLAFTLTASLALAADRTPLAIGSDLPDFKLRGVDDRDYTPRDFADAKVLVVIFTSNHCPTAQLYEHRIKQIVDDYRPRNVAFVAINPNHADAVRLDEMAWTDLDDTHEAMKIRARDHAFNFPYLDDGETQAVAEKFGAVATPHVFIFDQARKLRFQGRVDDSEREGLVKQRTTRDAIDALLADREPSVKTTKVFGCSIKWKEKAEDNRRWREKVAKEPVELTRADAAALRELRANKGTGKVRMINVWATWCGPCVSEFPELVEHNLRFRSREFELVTLAAEFPDIEPKVLKFLQKQQASTRNLIFGTTDKYALMEALDPEWNGALPHTLLIDPEGKVIYRETGAIDFLALRRTLLKALDAISPWPATGGQ